MKGGAVELTAQAVFERGRSTLPRRASSASSWISRSSSELSIWVHCSAVLSMSAWSSSRSSAAVG
jgi:hypothetical protein